MRVMVRMRPGFEPPRRLHFSNALTGGTLEPRGILEVRCPRLRRARPDLDRRLDPRWIVDRPCLQEGHSRHRLDRAEDRRPAGRAEPPLCDALVVLAGGLKRGECAALNRERLARYAHDHRERRSRLTLAVRAVASPLPGRLGVDAISHATAQAAACDGSGYGHAPKSYTSTNPRRNSGHPTTFTVSRATAGPSRSRLDRRPRATARYDNAHRRGAPSRPTHQSTIDLALIRRTRAAAASTAIGTGRALEQPTQAGLVEHGDVQAPGLLQLRARGLAGDEVVGLLGDRRS